MFSLDGKAVLVTGAAYGIGFAIAEALAGAGATIVFNCRSQENLDKALADYKAKGIAAHGYITDVTKEGQVTELAAKIREELGGVDILVNNAGIIKRIPMTEMSAEDFRQVVEIDLIGPFLCAKAVIPGMIEKGHGKIINICSMMSELGRETVSTGCIDNMFPLRGGKRTEVFNFIHRFFHRLVENQRASCRHVFDIGKTGAPVRGHRFLTIASPRLQNRCPPGPRRTPQE